MTVRLHRTTVAGVILVAAGALAACGDDDSSTAGTAPVTTAVNTADDEGPTTTVGGDGSDSTAAPDTGAAAADEFCGPMQTLAEYNGQENAIDTAGTDWPTVRAALLDTRDESDRLYGDAIEVAPLEIAGQLETLRDFSADALASAEEATSFEEFATVLQDVPEEVISATTELNDYVQENCGFGLSSG